MSKQEQIRKRLKEMMGQNGPLQTVLAKVVSVDEDAFSCVVDNDGSEIYDVQLRPVINGNESLTMIPAVDSWVLIARIEDDEEWMVIAVDEVTKYRLKVGECEMEIKEGFLVKKGEETLKKILDDLIAQINALTVPTNVGPSGTPINAPAFTAIKNRIDNFLK